MNGSLRLLSLRRVILLVSAPGFLLSLGPGAGAQVPQSFRVAVPYFTYQLKANKKIVTAGVCAK